MGNLLRLLRERAGRLGQSGVPDPERPRVPVLLRREGFAHVRGEAGRSGQARERRDDNRPPTVAESHSDGEPVSVPQYGEPDIAMQVGGHHTDGRRDSAA
ncbi:hypothetical protein C8039_12080 [Halogeometricum sp. wsp3]|nr:hypothetical protein C8039_12080 [Halogeometricum sp. wsp3]